MPKSDINNITLPVYKRLHGEIEQAKAQIPTSTEITALANTAIQADKDILSKITIVEEEGYTYVTFPYGVFPLALLTDSVAGLNKYLYIKYATLVDNTGNKVFDIDEFVSDDNVLEITLVGDNLNLEIIALDYILFNGGNGLGDTYQLYYPQPAGTKLYRHVIELASYPTGYSLEYNSQNGVTNNTINPTYAAKSLTIINDISEKITNFSLQSIEDTCFHAAITLGTGSRYTGEIIYVNGSPHFKISGMTTDANVFGGDISLSGISITSDDVTPL